MGKGGWGKVQLLIKNNREVGTQGVCGRRGEVATFDIAINYVAHVPKLHNLNIPQSSLSVHSVGAKKMKLSFVANIALKNGMI